MRHTCQLTNCKCSLVAKVGCIYETGCWFAIIDPSQVLYAFPWQNKRHKET